MNRETLSEMRGRDVSRETFDRLQGYLTLLGRWNARINLVSGSSLEQAWTRHVLDSVQLFDLAETPGKGQGLWADLGSGAGLPGLIVGILAREEAPGLAVTLVEADQRKAAFLGEAARAFAPDTKILAERAEATEPLNADILSARALAPLRDLLALAQRHLRLGGTAVFPKGARWREEVEESLATFRYDLRKHPSKADSNGMILVIKGISRV